MSKAAKAPTTARSRRKRKTASVPALSRAERDPVRTFSDFVELAFKAGEVPEGSRDGWSMPMQLIGETVVSCLTDGELQRLAKTARALMHLCEEEDLRRLRHGVARRPTSRTSFQKQVAV